MLGNKPGDGPLGLTRNRLAGSVKPRRGYRCIERPVLRDQRALKDGADGTKVIVTHSMCRKSPNIIFELVEALVYGTSNRRRWGTPRLLSQCRGLKNQ